MARVPSKLRKKVEWLFRRAEGALLPERVLREEGAHLDPDGARLALLAMSDDLAVVGASERLQALVDATDDPSARGRYVEIHGAAGVRRFLTRAAGTRIYRFEIETFPRHVNNVYVVCKDGRTVLVDVGSGLPTSRRDFALAFAALRSAFGEDLRWEDVDACVVTHAHSDHFAGANHLRETSRASLAVHELDARVLEGYAERLAVVTRDIEAYWIGSGVPADERAAMLAMYAMNKRLFRAERVDRVLRDGDVLAPGIRVHHVPGHCPGLVCLEVDDVLLTSDHVLARITPHQFPEAITAFAGLGHYFESLAKIRRLDGVSYALGGHEDPIADLRGRIDEIALFHEARLGRVLELCDAPRTVYELAKAMFGDQEGYGVILAIDEAGAHVEHLARQGRVRAARDGELVRYARA